MNQQKTGELLKRLRKEKGLTQEQLAEKFYVSSRTVSRWETGSNMPDVALLIELADFYDVDIREIIPYHTSETVLTVLLQEIHQMHSANIHFPALPTLLFLLHNLDQPYLS